MVTCFFFLPGSHRGINEPLRHRGQGHIEHRVSLPRPPDDKATLAANIHAGGNATLAVAQAVYMTKEQMQAAAARCVLSSHRQTRWVKLAAIGALGEPG